MRFVTRAIEGSLQPPVVEASTLCKTASPSRIVVACVPSCDRALGLHQLQYLELMGTGMVR